MGRCGAQLACLQRWPALATAAPVLGNGSTAELAAGGLVLPKSPALEMRAEGLAISAKQVRVRYRFVRAR